MKFDNDYINTHFEIPVLDQIHGEPNYNALYALKNNWRQMPLKSRLILMVVPTVI